MIRTERVEKLAEELKKRGLDALYIGPSTDLEYIGELDTHPDERVRGLTVDKNGKCFAMTPLLYKEEIVRAFGNVPFYAEWNDHEGFTGAFRRGCEHLGLLGGKIAFNDGVRAVDMLAIRDAMDIQMVNGHGWYKSRSGQSRAISAASASPAQSSSAVKRAMLSAASTVSRNAAAEKSDVLACPLRWPR